ncbi:hypothetical protein THRCLA_07941 [Thraustotheca clavata]|uniref:MRH domain-containing protein n=1 Tax=Thraustotheca clavata TaxID=74557 RepID=A0A1V9ZBK1_9STRA|nr:hypothetical protein THRCLA_07941 [Thraustotheca clavata]
MGMRRAVALVALLELVLGAENVSDLSYGFSACVHDKRMMYYYTPTEIKCAANSNYGFVMKPPVNDMDCTVPCPRGYVLGANFSGLTPVSGCEACATGTYSLGGGNLFSSSTNAWRSPLPAEIFTECLTRNIFTSEWEANCNPWTPDSSGTYIHSGNNTDIMERYSATVLFSILRISLSFVVNGSVTFQYKVDAEAPYDGLMLTMDSTTLLPLVSSTGDWVEKTFKIPAGVHTLTWQFTKDYNGDSGLDMAMLRLIEIIGTSYSDMACYPCGGYMTRKSSAQCRICDVNQYATNDANGTFTCFPCPSNTYSRAGSIGISSCVSSRPCSYSDVAAAYTTCINGFRNITRSWAQPKTCNSTHPDSIALPPNEIMVGCAGVCMTCGDGQIINPNGMLVEQKGSLGRVTSNNTMCLQCPIGTVSIKSQWFGGSTRKMWSQWPSIVDNQTAIHNGWKLTEMGITRDLSSGISWTGTYPLDFTTTQIHNGTLSLNYTLSNLPANTSTGRAWLELYINKDPTVLTHAAQNGSFFVQVPLALRLDGNSSLAVSIVWRTSNAALDKVASVLITSIGFTGTEFGGSSFCDACPPGYKPNDNQSRCAACSSGTYSLKKDNGVVVCENCPPNSFSNGQAAQCTPCGNNTYSAGGATVCQAPTYLNDTKNQLTYNLLALQRLVSTDDTLNNMITNSTLATSRQFSIDATNSFMLGIFRPVEPKFSKQSMLIVSSVLTNSYNQILVGSIMSYVVGLTIVNYNEAGGNFMYNTPSMGLVQCTVPSKYRVVNGGGKMDISTLDSGTGIRVVYSMGSVCSSLNGPTFYTTTIDFICNPSANNTGPILADSSSYSSYATWNTPAACPLCSLSLFTYVLSPRILTNPLTSQTKSQCSGGNQILSSTSSFTCVGGDSLPAQSIITCSDIVLDQSTAAMAAGVVVLIVLLVVALLVGFVIVYRRYKNTMKDFLYLKGQMNTGHTLLDESAKSPGGVFEFANRDNTVFSPTTDASIDVNDENDVEEEIDLGNKQSVTILWRLSVEIVERRHDLYTHLIWMNSASEQLREEDLLFIFNDTTSVITNFTPAIDPASLEPLAFNRPPEQYLLPLDIALFQAALEILSDKSNTITPRTATLTRDYSIDTNALSPQVKPVGFNSSRTVRHQPLCQVPNCTRRVRSRGYCKGHGGGRKCTVPGCGKSSQNGDLCIGHGGGKLCSTPGCAKAAQSHGLCKAHGGGARCKFENCMKSSQGGGFCRAHGGGKRCKADNCNKGAQRGDYCATHGGFRKCLEHDCTRTDRGGGYCEVHRKSKLCTIKGCKKLSKNHGLCTVHLRNIDKAIASNKL